MGSLDHIAAARARGRRAAASGGGSLDQIAAQRKGPNGSLAEPVDTAPPAEHKGGGGVFGALGRAAHFTAQKTELAARDLKGMPGGIVGAGLAITKDEIDAAKKGDLVNATPIGALLHGKRTGQLEKQTLNSSVESVKHPLRDPFATATTVLPLFGALGKAADIGTAGRITSAPRLLKAGDAEIPLKASRNAATRIAQAGHDKVVQKAMDTNPEGRIARYGAKRVHGSLAETARYQQRLRAVPAQMLERVAKKLGRGGTKRVHDAALELTSVNTTPEKAAAYHEAQAEKGVNPEQNRAVAKLYREVAKQKLLTTNEHGDVVVNADKHPMLAAADVHLAKVQGRGDEIMKRYNVRSADQLLERLNAPGRIREGASYEPQKLSTVENPERHVGNVVRATVRVERDALKDAYKQLLQEDNAPDRLSLEEFTKQHPELVDKKITRTFEAPGKVEAVDTKAGIATVRFFKKGGGTWTREIPLHDVMTGKGKIVGGESARPGRGFVSYKTSEPKAGKSAMAGAPSPVIGEAKSPINSQEFKGEGVAKGLVPNDVAGQAARHLHRLLRFVNTSEFRNQIIKTGSAVRRTSRDVLIKVPGEEHADIPPEIESLLGRRDLTVDDVAGIEQALNAYREDLVPGLKDRFAADRAQGIGTPAPAGYRWVDRNVVGDLARMPRGPRGAVARGADWMNSAVTAATVYFKLGHIGTRVLTNAATNIIQGSAAPVQLFHSRLLWGALSDADRMRALAAAGQHGFESMPHEGFSKAALVAGKGAGWWARHVDAPFRFNALAYEARRAGIMAPDAFHHFLDQLENPQHLTPEQFAKVDGIAKAANREAIAYDRLSESERRFIARGIWFYNWVRGTVNFAANTAMEHPYKAGALGAAGVQGRKNQQNELGALPSYEAGLFKLAGGERPLTADFSTFSPFATPADVLDTVARPAEISGQLNPAYTAATDLIFGLNQYGQKSKSPIKDAAAALVAPTPEAQVIQAYLNRHKNQSRGMFTHRPSDAILRALLGPGLPRRLNVSAGHRAAGREKSGR